MLRAESKILFTPKLFHFQRLVRVKVNAHSIRFLSGFVGFLLSKIFVRKFSFVWIFI